MKCNSFESAKKKKILIQNIQGDTIGMLIPVGEWIISDEKKINVIRSWRQNAMHMFLTHFIPTFDSTLNYLKNFSIKQEDRLFFLIYSHDSKKLIGHMGIADVNIETGEFDNPMRGEKGGDSQLIYYSEVTLLNWCFKNLDITKIYARILSYNSIMLLLQKRIGFLIDSYNSLFKYKKNDYIFHDVVDECKSNVTYKMIKTSLSKRDFYKKFYWLA
jgi:RimJ/RimL family protein N-acetyltransferase